MLKSKNEIELMELTKEFDVKSKEMTKIIEKIHTKEQSVDKIKEDIMQLNGSLIEFEEEIISILKKRQRLSKKIFGVSNNVK